MNAVNVRRAVGARVGNVDGEGVVVRDYETAGRSRQIFPVLPQDDGKTRRQWQAEQRVVSVDYARSVPQGLRSVGGSQSYARDRSPA